MTMMKRGWIVDRNEATSNGKEVPGKDGQARKRAQVAGLLFVSRQESKGHGFEKDESYHDIWQVNENIS